MPPDLGRGMPPFLETPPPLTNSWVRPRKKLYITNNYLCNSSINYCLQGCYFHYNIRIGGAAARKQTVDIMTFT